MLGAGVDLWMIRGFMIFSSVFQSFLVDVE